ncbi:MAG TPA: hypothetical protein VHV78_12210, partial [Gemmatimonadaceae bacterium]|nr:hypothetical protein [Gemmatimonadaceae bacterium]
MIEPRLAILTVCALLIPASRELAAQVASKVEAGQYTVVDGALPVSAIRLAPTVQFEFPHATFSAHGSAFVSDQTMQLADGIVSGTFTSPTVYGVHAELLGNASRALDDRSLGTDQVDVQTRVHLQFQDRAGVWFGGGVARPWRVGVISSADIADAGAWTKLGTATSAFGAATFSTTFTNYSFTKVASVHDTGTAALSTSALSCAAPGIGPSADAAIHAMMDASPTDASGGDCDRQSRFSDLEGSFHWEVG